MESGIIRKAGLLANYVSLVLAAFVSNFGMMLGWNSIMITLFTLPLVFTLVTFVLLHIRSGAWKLTHTRLANLNDEDRQITRAARERAYRWFAAFTLFYVFFRNQVMYDRLSPAEFGMLLYVAVTLPSGLLAWAGKSSILKPFPYRKWGKRSAILLGTLLVLFLLNLTLIRPWQHNWGATAEESHRPMPGDELVVDPDMNATRVVTVNASPEEVWPWIAQIGYQRGGFYSYDFLDNEDVPSAREILPEFQNVQLGDSVQIGRGAYMGVIALEAGKVLGFQFLNGPWAGNTWVFGLYPDGSGRTRLVSRLRCNYIWHYRHIGPWMMIDTFEIIMMRACLKGIKERVEAYNRG